MKLTNVTNGPKVAGGIRIDAGQTVDVELSADDKKALEAAGWFKELGGEPDGEGAEPDPKPEPKAKK